VPPVFSPSEADYLVSEQFSFYGVRSLALLSTPNLEDLGVPLRLSGMGDPTSSHATAGIALRVPGALKSHHLDKVIMLLNIIPRFIGL
jgi:hypothetical protein